MVSLVPLSKNDKVQDIRRKVYFFEKGVRLLMEIPFDFILNSIAEGVVVVDRDGNIIYTNPAYHHMMGLGNVIGKNMRDVDRGARILEVIKNGKLIINEYYKLPILKKEIVVNITPLYTDSILAGAVSFFRNLSDVVQLSEKLMKVLEENKDSLMEDELLIGKSRVFLDVLEIARRAAHSDYTVLITGESGTGKEIFATVIYKWSQRANSPFVKVNCAATPETLFESELFGYEGGSFTGANSSGKKGKFELANKGTIFLDEIGELSLPIQAKLLRVLQEKEIDKIGGSKPQKLDVRVIAATNKNLEKMVGDGLFRQDLFYRLFEVPIHIPPLRVRRDDIVLFADHFLKSIIKNTGRFYRLSKDVLDIFYNYDWPGNVRELFSTIKYSTVLCDGDIIYKEHLPAKLLIEINKDKKEKSSINLQIDEYKKQLILDTLLSCNGNRSEAIRKLGISRKAFYKQLSEIGIPYKAKYRNLITS